MLEYKWDPRLNCIEFAQVYGNQSSAQIDYLKKVGIPVAKDLVLRHKSVGIGIELYILVDRYFENLPSFATDDGYIQARLLGWPSYSSYAASGYDSNFRNCIPIFEERFIDEGRLRVRALQDKVVKDTDNIFRLSSSREKVKYNGVDKLGKTKIFSINLFDLERGIDMPSCPVLDMLIYEYKLKYRGVTGIEFARRGVAITILPIEFEAQQEAVKKLFQIMYDKLPNVIVIYINVDGLVQKIDSWNDYSKLVFKLLHLDDYISDGK